MEPQMIGEEGEEMVQELEPGVVVLAAAYFGALLSLIVYLAL